MPKITCPHCNAPVQRLYLLSWRPSSRPYVCPKCTQASRVIRPFGQQILAVILWVALGSGFSALLQPYGYIVLPWLLAGILATGIDVLLIVTTSSLRKITSVFRAPEA